MGNRGNEPTCGRCAGTAECLVVSVCVMFSLTASLVARGQSSVDGAIGGRVTDQRGDLVAAATVSVVSEATGFEQFLKTGPDGSFLLTHAAPGAYRVKISAIGFAGVIEEVTVGLGAIAAADAQLKLATVETLISIDSAPIPVVASSLPGSPANEESAETATAPGLLTTASQLDLLPMDGRRWQSFALLLPETGGGSTSGGEAAVSFRGLATTQNSSQIDGASNDQSFGGAAQGSGGGAGREAEEEGDSGTATGVGGDGSRSMYGRHAGAAYTFSQGAVQEFRVNSGSYLALDGHAVGGVVTTVSKSGTIALHGSMFYLARDSAWGATNPFSVASTYAEGVVTNTLMKPRDLRQQFGGSVGGPVVWLRRATRNGATAQPRVFYFAAVDVQRRANDAVSSPGYPNFFALTATQRALLGNRGVSTKKTDAALTYLDSLTGTVPRREDQQIAFGKVDWQISASNKLSVQENHIRWNSPGGVRSEPVVDRGLASLGNAYGKVDAGVARLVSLWTSHLSNEVRVAYGRDFEYETAQPPLLQEPAIGPGGLAPEISIGTNGFTFGTPASLGRKAYPDERRLQVAELVEWSHRRHLIQAGFDFSQIHDRIDALSNQEGTFRYDSGVTAGKAGGLVDWITDYTFSANAYPNGACPSIVASIHRFCFRTFTQSFGEQSVSFPTQEWAGFVQDQWKAAPTLQVTFGVRYEYEREPSPQRLNPAIDALFGSHGATSVFPRDKNNAGPRVGIAWQPLGVGRGTIRAEYGVYYGRLPGGTIRAALLDTAMPGTATHVRITPTTVTNCPQVANQGFGYGCTYLAEPGAAVSTTTSAMLFDKRFRLPMVQQGTFAIERGVGFGITAGASYVFNLDRQLPDSVDINIAPSTATREFQLQGGPVSGSGPRGVTNGEVFVLPYYTARVSPLYGLVTDIVSNTNATYNAMVLSAERQSRKGLEFRATWTWSKAIDYGQNGGATPRTNGQLDPFVLGYDRGLSTLNYPHKITASAIWEPSLVTPKRVLRLAANGWQVSPLFVETSGRPYSYEIFGGTRLSGGHTSINGSGGAVYLPTVGRNTLRLPETVHADLRVNRSIRVTERLRLRASAEVFNLPNHVKLHQHHNTGLSGGSDGRGRDAADLPGRGDGCGRGVERAAVRRLHGIEHG